MSIFFAFYWYESMNLNEFGTRMVLYTPATSLSSDVTLCELSSFEKKLSWEINL